MAAVEATDTMIKSADGTDLHIQRWSPLKNDDIKVELLLVPGYMEHSGRYSEFAIALVTKHSIALTTMNYRGHGKSSGARGLITDWEQYVDDYEAALKHLNDIASDDVPKFVMGHSTGGLITMEYYSNKAYPKNPALKSFAIHGLICTSPFLAPADKIPWIKVQVCKILGRCIPWLELATGMSADRLTSDPVKQKERNNDTVIFHHATLGWGYHVMLAQDRALKNLAENPFPVPFFLLFSSKDQVSDPQTNEQAGTKIQQKDKTIVARATGAHELLNEVDRVELYDTVAKWIKERV